MKTLVSQRFSRSVPSSASRGYLPYSRQKCQKFARYHPQGYPGNFQVLVQGRSQAESPSNQTLRCSERGQPSDLRCVLVPNESSVSRSGTRNELQLIHFSAAKDPQVSLQNEASSACTCADRFVNSIPVELSQPQRAGGVSQDRKGARPNPCAHFDEVDPFLFGKTGSDRELATDSFCDRDDKCTRGGSGLVLAFGECDRSRTADVGARVSTRPTFLRLDGGLKEAAHAGFWPASTSTISCTTRVRR